MKVEMGPMPRLEQIAAIEWQARRMRAEVVASGLRAIARGVARLFAWGGSARPAAEPTARA